MVPAAPDPGAPGSDVSGLNVLVDLRVNSTVGSDITMAMWEQFLYFGAVRDEFALRGFGKVIDGTGTLVTPDGSRHPAPVGGVSLGMRTDQVFDAVPSDITSTISERAAGMGLSSTKVQALHVLQDALVIRAVSDSPATDLAAYTRQGGLEFLLGQRPDDFEGVYFEVDDSSGNPVYITFKAPRSGGGGSWSSPSSGMTTRRRSARRRDVLLLLA